MAKKQTIILLHGNTPLTTATGLTQGELAVYNASSTTESAIYSKTSGDALVTFPSKDYVDAEINKLDVAGNVGAINQEIANLKAADTAIRGEFAAADSAITSAYKAADSAITEAYKAADSAITEAYKAADEDLQGQITAINESIEGEGGINGKIAALEAADTTIRGEFAAADSVITEAYKAADSAITEAYKAADSAITEAYKAADSALQTAVDKKLDKSTYDTKMEALDSEISGLGDLLDGYTTKGAVKSAVDSKVAQSEYNTKVESLQNQITANAEAIAALDDTYATDAELEAVQTELEGMIAAAGAKATTKVVEGTDAGNNLTISATTGADSSVTYTVNLVDVASASVLTAMNAVVTTVVGSDSGKSMRTVANEELAAQLLSGKADADFKTLQDLAAWLEDHPESAAAMNEAIEANATAIENEVTRATSAETALNTAVNAKVEQSEYNTKVQELAGAIALKAADSEFQPVKTDVATIKADYLKAADKTELSNKIAANTEAINKLGDTYATDAELAGVKTELEGKITAKTVVVAKGASEGFITVTPTNNTTTGTTYTITTNDVASASALTALGTRVQTAEGNITNLTNNKADKTALEGVSTRVKTIEDDYLKAADKTALNNAITAATQTLSNSITGVSNRVTTIEGAYVKTIKIDNQTFSVATGTNQVDLTNMVIDGGTY